MSLTTPSLDFSRVEELLLCLGRAVTAAAFVALHEYFGGRAERGLHLRLASVLPATLVLSRDTVSLRMEASAQQTRWRELVRSGRHHDLMQRLMAASRRRGDPLWTHSDDWPALEDQLAVMYGTWGSQPAKRVYESWAPKSQRDYLRRLTQSEQSVEGLLRSHPGVIAAWCIDGINHFVDQGLPLQPIRALVDRHPGDPVLDLARARLAWMEGRLGEASRLLTRRTDDAAAETLGLLAIVQGDVKGASRHYYRATVHERKRTPGGDLLIQPSDVLAPLSHIASDFVARIQSAHVSARRVVQRGGASAARALWVQRLLARNAEMDMGAPPPTPPGAWGALLAGLVSRWTGLRPPREALRAALTRAQAAGHRWMAAELARVLDESEPAPPAGCRPLLGLLALDADWELTLGTLEGVAPPKAKAQRDANGRVAFRVEEDDGALLVSAVRQSRTAEGWGSPSTVTLAGLAGGIATVPELTERDEALLPSLLPDTYAPESWRVRISPLAGLKALVGHPALLQSDRADAPLQVEPRAPVLRLDAVSGGLCLRVEPAVAAGADAAWSRPRPDLFELTVFTPAQLAVARLIGAGFTLPLSGRGRMMNFLDRIEGTFPVLDSTATGGAHSAIQRADGRPVISLRPRGGGLRAQVSVAPLGLDGPRMPLGAPPTTAVARVDGRSRAVVRDLAAERAGLGRLVEQVPALVPFLANQPLVIDALDEALALVEVLGTLGEAAYVEWPEGGVLHIRPPLVAGALRLQVRQTGPWLSAAGHLDLGEGLQLDLDEVMRILEVGGTRFLRLGEGQFVALADQLRAQLRRLGRMGSRHAGGLRLHSLAAPALLELGEGAVVDGDADWQAQVARLRCPPPAPPLPTGLRATLRPYQAEGFAWMCRLTSLGLGGILADDMGLGKTVQTLAYLLHRAAEGPSLVVAPTSVCSAWAEQAARFAPDLRVIRFGEGDREAALRGLGPGALVICSYGLLVSEIERLAPLSFAALVLDEAQAIKNTDTLRHQCVARIAARQRFALSGTPVENHVGELWALMELLNPGALGPWAQFRSRFVDAAGAGEGADALRRLLRPFVLRRTKAMVLGDLPPRTDVVLPIPLDPRARHTYEALRQRAIGELRSEGAANTLTVLGWLTRLRLFCCHPALVLGEGTPLPAAKMEAFTRLVGELRENKHRALVFSQFVKHLDKLRVWLDAEKIPYQYLDGATPARERAARVEAFQGGEGDLFLISMKAGGTGLTLTAADYVVHMDPWWNPAVEDQASDRAHRIGQQRPVTVYRLITQGTIEEQMMALHRDKRDLADRLLDGAAAAASLSGEELLALLVAGAPSGEDARGDALGVAQPAQGLAPLHGQRRRGGPQGDGLGAEP
jgi:superfamily II DNA or RNA helicase